jgi:hypothetical protein
MTRREAKRREKRIKRLVSLLEADLVDRHFRGARPKYRRRQCRELVRLAVSLGELWP